jgi:hypothetical protein
MYILYGLGKAHFLTKKGAKRTMVVAGAADDDVMRRNIFPRT